MFCVRDSFPRVQGFLTASVHGDIGSRDLSIFLLQQRPLFDPPYSHIHQSDPHHNLDSYSTRSFFASDRKRLFLIGHHFFVHFQIERNPRYTITAYTVYFYTLKGDFHLCGNLYPDPSLSTIQSSTVQNRRYDGQSDTSVNRPNSPLPLDISSLRSLGRSVRHRREFPASSGHN